MHKLASKPITLDCFETDDFENVNYDSETSFDCWGSLETDYLDVNSFVHEIISFCEKLRLKQLQTKDVRYWKELVRWLPESWLQTRTITMNYENLFSMVHQRKNHKLTEWHSFCDWVASLPYVQELIFDI